MCNRAKSVKWGVTALPVGRWTVRGMGVDVGNRKGANRLMAGDHLPFQHRGDEVMHYISGGRQRKVTVVIGNEPLFRIAVQIGQTAVGVAEPVDKGDVGNLERIAVALVHELVGFEYRLSLVVIQAKRNCTPVVLENEFEQGGLPLWHGADKDDIVHSHLFQPGRQRQTIGVHGPMGLYTPGRSQSSTPRNG